ncbi:MAG: hypothetical protein J7L95_04670 [Prolixibacteraceae bacterium]|nr:hypothetical protein [Prolixibacteraceae bacterium]
MRENYWEMVDKYKRRLIFLNYPGGFTTVYIINGEKATRDKIKEIKPDKIESIKVNKGNGKESKNHYSNKN